MADAPRSPHIVASRGVGDEMELDLAIDADLLWFQGHFPDFPILPGVVQLDWALDLARRYLGLELHAGRQFQVKYKAGIFPGDHLTLKLVHNRQKNRLAFEYLRNGAICSSGQVAIAP